MKILEASFIAQLLLFLIALFTLLSVTVVPTQAQSTVLINEVDADTPGADALEFVELYDGGAGNTPLDGLVLVLFNGSDDASYRSFDLDGKATGANGYFVLGNTAVFGVELTFGNGTLQNGADAVALYQGNASDFPNNTPVTTADLLDAVVYDTNDPDDPGLLSLLNVGQPQLNEGGNGNASTESNQRCPNGSGGARNTGSTLQAAPTPGADNACPSAPNNAPVFLATGPFSVAENSATGTAVGDVNANDGEGGGTDVGITYAITLNADPDGDGNDAFSINASSGVITVNDPGDLNFELHPSLSITVQADDGQAANNTATVGVTVNLSNVDEEEINVMFGATPIPNGDNAPSTGKGTDFGAAAVSGGTIERSFTIENKNAEETLTINGISIAGSHAGDFSVGSPNSFPFNIGAASSASFTLRFDPTGGGTRNATASLSNTDPNKNPYTFDLTGNGTLVSTTTTLTSTTNPSAFGQSVTFSATVSGSGGTPTGSVNFSDNGTGVLGCSGVTLSGPTAQCITSSLSAGGHTIVADYSGDANFEASSGSLAQGVQPNTLSVNVVGNVGADAVTSTGGTASPGPIDCPAAACTAAFNFNDDVTLNVAVDASSSFLGWSGDCAALGSNLSSVLTMDGAKSCTASFEVLAGTSSTVFISLDGSDVNDCLSLVTACATIQAGVNKVSSGGTVAVAGGRYGGGVSINKPLNLTCDPALGSALACAVDGAPGITVNVNGVTIGGFTFQNFGASPAVRATAGGVNLRGNAFVGTPGAVGVDGPAITDNNWWGCNGGPSDADHCTTATGGATFDPWLVASLEATPNPATVGASTQITVDLARNSGGQIVSNTLSRPTSLRASDGVLAQNALPIGKSHSSRRSGKPRGSTWWVQATLLAFAVLLVLLGFFSRCHPRLALVVALFLLLGDLGGCGLLGGDGLQEVSQRVSISMVNGVATVTLSSSRPGDITVTVGVDRETLVRVVGFIVRPTTLSVPHSNGASGAV